MKTLLRTSRTIITLLVLSVAATGCAKWFKSENKPSLSGRVTGTVTYRERIALPPDAKIIVSLEDVSRVGASSIFIAQQTLRASSQVPIAFDLRYIPSAIDLRNRYSVRAVILDNRDELLWTTTESYPVNFKEADQPFNLMLQRVGNPMANHPAYNALDKSARPNVAAFKCDELEFIAKFPSDDKVEILLAGRTIVLPHVISGSGARYSNGSTTFWNKGNEALFEMNGVSYKGCKTDPLSEAPTTPAAPAKVKGK
ncbi:Membrane-bound lysozyme inhibitor of C-type lysozyme precursor [compost metagenome]